MMANRAGTGRCLTLYSLLHRQVRCHYMSGVSHS